MTPAPSDLEAQEEAAKLRELAEKLNGWATDDMPLPSNLRYLLEQAVSALRSSAVRVEELQSHAEAAERRCQAYEQALADADQKIEALEDDKFQVRKDALRYRWLRAQHWNENLIAVVAEPKDAVRLGSYCPSDALLDAACDAALGKAK
jgi:chromosome segregation ATPase